MDLPTFPNHNYNNNYHDNVSIGHSKLNDWETTYNSTQKIQKTIPQQIKVDTITLQKTNWTPGNVNEEYKSISHSEFQPIPPQQPTKGRTRDELMATSFSLGDDNFYETRETLSNSKASKFTEYEKVTKTQIPQSNINLIQTNNNDWSTTSKDSYKLYNNYKTPDKANFLIKDGEGTKSTMMNQSSYRIYETETGSNYIKHNKQSNNPINNNLKQSTLKIGDEKTSYITTNKSDFKNIDLNNVQNKINKPDINKSGLYLGNKNSNLETTSYQDNFHIYEDHKPPSLMPRTAFISHHEFRNCNETFQTTSKDSYKPLELNPQKPLDLHLNEGNIKIGESNQSIKTSLYQDTYKKHYINNNNNKNDTINTKAFHTEHHTNVTTIAGLNENKTTSQESYINHKGIIPRSAIKFPEKSTVISMADPSLIITESTMKKDYLPIKNFEKGSSVNLALQNSHIQIKGEMKDEWKTTQSEYFKFKTYKKY